MRKLISIILIISICMITFTSYATDDVNESTENETNEVQVEGLNKLTEQRDDLKEKMEEAQKELEEVNEELTENLQEISKLDESISNTENSLNELNEKIESAENEIQTIQVELDKVTVEYEEKNQMLDERLVATYKAGEIQYLDVLLSSKSISEFISSYYLISEMIKYDSDLIEIVEKEKNEIELKSSEVQKKKQALSTQKQTQIRVQNALGNTKALRQNLVTRLSDQEKDIQTEIDEYNAQVNSIESEIYSLAKISSFGENYVGGTMNWPIANNYKITSYYGMRTHPVTGVYKLHTGVDIGAKMGTNFLAAAYGVVAKAEYNKAYGNMVILDHGGGVQTLYAHGSSIEVEVGQVVNSGDTVLKVGSTGYSTGPHAHFEIRINGKTVNPLEYIAIPKGN